MFFVLAQFDPVHGHRVVWASEDSALAAVPLIEFKMIVSGMHEREKDAVYFTVGNYHGVARYACRGRQARTRQDVHMYALAALTPLSEKLPWSQESLLKVELAKFLTSGFDTTTLPLTPLARPDPRSHPILAVNAYLQMYGPTVFSIWKTVLSRARLLLAPVQSASVRVMCQCTYVAAQLALVPADVQHLLPKHKPPVQCLYNVILSDLPKLQAAESFVATTADTVLLGRQRDACDEYAEPARVVDLGAQRNVYSTYRDRHRFRLLLDGLGLSAAPQNRTHHLRRAAAAAFDAAADSCVNGFVWWASAGESTMLDREEGAPLTQALPLLAPTLEPSADVVAVVGQFQEYTRQLVRAFARAYIDDEEVVQLTLTDVAAMGLDPFSQSDRVFLNRFGLAWFDRPVVFGCCC